ncbi:MAG TPA: bifunctional alpha,alpha-trehalose-phosphate synthase (UDP-forming)/trehalose-phosphatase [Candidatus Saccharimonadales bacterium]|nr:bifunctional alpha,alpha-trehalose-phosphate synthase (UDP-forming)/trehalose-phosphatase [Candidatus Saccharimonadales bacterium]
MGNLVIVSNRLPVSVRKTDGTFEFFQSLGGVATGLASYTKRPGTKWIGWPGIASDGLSETDKQFIARQLKKRRCYPVFLTQAQLDDFYNGYSNSVLWPLFHDLPLAAYPKKYWRAYRKVNELFAAEVLRLSKPGSAIWVHDYHLMLAPELLRQADRSDKIGHFLHIPFPETPVLERLGEAKQLLQGVLGADLAGFHTTGYAQNFLEACDELLGTGALQDFVELGERTIRVADFPMGIDYAHFARTLQQPKNRTALRRLRQNYKGKKVILTVDRLDPTKGLVERLRAYQLLLRERPELRGQVVMVMIVAPSRTEIPAYQALKSRMDELLAEVAWEFGNEDWRPVDFMYETVPLEKVMLYFRLADVAFITPLRDGMNLVAKEYLASKPGGKGVLILSETAGAAEELQDAIQVNPTRPRELVQALSRALNLPKRELRVRAKRMQQHIEQFTVQHWANSFISTLQRPLTLKPMPTFSLTENRTKTMLTAYHKAAKRLLLLDYDGTLRAFVDEPMAAKPTAPVLKLLKRLGANPANEVVIVSGRSRQNMADWFGHLPVALSAEHGAYFRRVGGKNWHRTSSEDTTWHKPVHDLFSYYAEATPGAFVEQKDVGVVWHYRTAKPFDAQKSLVAVRRLLKPIVKRYRLIVKDGNHALEVHSGDISKGRAAQEWLIHDHDFVLAIGDDVTDEDMFAAVPPTAYSIKVGRGQTAARLRVKNVDEAVALLSRF